MKAAAVILILSAAILWSGGADTDRESNDFYSRSPMRELDTAPLIVDGEVENPGPVNLKGLALHSVTVRQARWHQRGREFVGAYRFEGVSLFDILRNKAVRKRDDSFPPPVDLFLEILDGKGKRVFVSWGEVFYSRVPHRILVATRVSPIVPSKIRSVPPLPKNSLLVCADDLYAIRSLDSPRRITVRSVTVKIPIHKGMAYVSSERIKIAMHGKQIAELSDSEAFPGKRLMRSVFFGRGRGFHGFHNYSGWDLGAVLKRSINITPEFLARGYLVVTSVDGYRAVFGASEVFNRNDGNAFILLEGGLCENKGPWALYPGPDFFSDRAVAGINAIKAVLMKTEG